MAPLDVMELDKMTDRRELLSFHLGREEYGIDILAVREIRAYEKPTRIVNTPPFIRGVISLRGVVVPIVDLRIKFDTGTVSDADLPAVIIVDVAGRALGIVVDAVSDVLAFEREDLRPLPELSSSIDTQFIQGLASIEGRLVILADIATLMASPDMGLIDAPVLVDRGRQISTPPC